LRKPLGLSIEAEKRVCFLGALAGEDIQAGIFPNVDHADELPGERVLRQERPEDFQWGIDISL